MNRGLLKTNAATSLGLCGDGDNLDLTLDVEEYFDVRLPDAGLEACRTVGDLYGLLVACLPDEAAPDRCATAACFYRLRRVLGPTLATELHPRTAIDRLKAVPFRRLQKIIAADYTMHAPRGEASWAHFSLLLLSLALGATAYILGSTGATVVYSAVGPLLLLPLAPLKYPSTMATFGDLVRIVAERNAVRLARPGARVDPAERWDAFLDIVSQHGMIAREAIRPDTLILVPKRSWPWST